MKYIVTFLCLVILKTFSAQKQVNLHFTPKVESSELAMNQVVTVNEVKVNFDHFNYYISNLHIIHDGNQDLDLSDTVFLVKANDFRLNLGQLNIENVEKIKFGVGVPEILNHLDISQYNENHPLSFQSPSMHWGWAAGYMHMIVGGYADGNNDGIPEAYFELHNLGDINFFELELQTTNFNTSENQSDIFIDCNLDNWLSTINLGTVNIKHGENGVNKIVMENLNAFPVFTSSSSASTKTLTKFNGEIYFEKNENALTISWKEIFNANKIELISISGKIMNENNEIGNQGSIRFENLKNGIYFVNFYSKENTILNQIKVIY
jgi:hypothetical protein